MIFGLIDCNSFYCSCQRAFEPDLKRKPVVVLSNNDGCAIARTPEAKALGIGMGQPFHQLHNDPKMEDVRWFSGNFPLYGDMSRRVWQVLQDYSPRVETYSIDEMFLDLTGLPDDLHAHCGAMRQAVQQITKIPTCVGWGPTKTIAKLANGIAKSRPEMEGLCDLRDEKTRNRFYRNLSIGEVWGIGRRLTPRLNQRGIWTIHDFIQMDRASLRQFMSITGLRLQEELKGHSCLELSELVKQRQGMTVSRSFGTPITDYNAMHQTISAFALRAAEKLRHDKLDAAHIAIFIQTNRFRRDDTWYANQIGLSCEPTNDSFELARHATHLLRRIWRPGYRYVKAGVMLHELASAEEGKQTSLFAFTDSSDARRDKLMNALDQVNDRYGRNTLFPLSKGLGKAWNPRQNMLSRHYTTNIHEIMEAEAY